MILPLSSNIPQSLLLQHFHLPPSQYFVSSIPHSERLAVETAGSLRPIRKQPSPRIPIPQSCPAPFRLTYSYSDLASLRPTSEASMSRKQRSKLISDKSGWSSISHSGMLSLSLSTLFRHQIAAMFYHHHHHRRPIQHY